MPELSAIGRWLVIAGVALAVIGGLVWLAGRIPGLKSIPGTLQVNLGGITCVFPILTMIVLSVLLTILLNVLVRLLR